jgi:hypothetical protein
MRRNNFGANILRARGISSTQQWNSQSPMRLVGVGVRHRRGLQTAGPRALIESDFEEPFAASIGVFIIHFWMTETTRRWNRTKNLRPS